MLHYKTLSDRESDPLEICFGEDILAQTIYEGSEKPGSGLDSPTPTSPVDFWNSEKG